MQEQMSAVAGRPGRCTGQAAAPAFERAVIDAVRPKRRKSEGDPRR